MALVLANISNIIIPVIIFYIIAYGIANKSNVYEDFVKGAKEGLKTVVGIMPTLVALMTAVGILRASGFLDLLGDVVRPLSETIGFPAELITSIIMSCTETIFYTMSVYFIAAKVTKTRYTLKVALMSTLAGIAASVVLAGMM